MRSRISIALQGDYRDLVLELDPNDLAYGLTTCNGDMELDFEIRHEDDVTPAEALDQALSDGHYSGVIRGLLFVGKFEYEDITPDLSALSFEDLYRAAQCDKFEDSIDILTEFSGIGNWSWFVGDERDAWHSLTVRTRLNLLTEWLTHIKEEYA